MRMQPMLLLGWPRTGKTMLARAIGRALGVRVQLIGMAHSTASFALGGLDGGWATARPGEPFRQMVWGDCATHVFVLGELDKVSSDDRHSPLGPLYALLEPATAMCFRDDMVSLPIDTRSLIWVATANSLDSIPKPLQTRFQIVHAEAPSPAQLPSVLHSVWCELLASEPWWGACFEPELPQGTVQILADADSLRGAAQRLRRGAARAAAAGRRQVLPTDLPDEGGRTDPRRMPIGFL